MGGIHSLSNHTTPLNALIDPTCQRGRLTRTSAFKDWWYYCRLLLLYILFCV